MQAYSKLIAAVLGLSAMLFARYVLQMGSAVHDQLLIDAALAVATAIGVYMARNKPRKRKPAPRKRKPKQVAISE